MSPKKSFLERMGLVDPGNSSEESSKEAEVVKVPELEKVPNLSGLSASDNGKLKAQPNFEQPKLDFATNVEKSHSSQKGSGGKSEQPLQAGHHSKPEILQSDPNSKIEFSAEQVSYSDDKFDQMRTDGHYSGNQDYVTGFKADPRIGEKLDLIIGAYEKNKLQTIDEIYRNARMETDTKRTIFMSEIFMNAMPSNLPHDVKRETVLNILKISSIDVEYILGDAYKRIDTLNTVLEDTVKATKDIYDRNINTINELEKRIQDLNDMNVERQKFQDDQNTMIEYEIQKIINLVEFVKPKGR